MTRRILLLLATVLPVLLFAQKEYDRAVSGLSTNKTTVVKFTVPQSTPGHNVTALETPFAQAEFISAMVSGFKGKAIEKVQLVYTTFAVSPSFDQKGLNGRRLKNLYAVAPGAFASPLTEWELVAQTGAASPEEGRNYFHGFVITWRPDATPELVKEEMRELDSLYTKIRGGHGHGHGVSDGGTGTTGGGPKTGFKPKEITYPDGTKTTLARDIPEDSLWRFIKASDEHHSVIYAKYGDTAHTIVIVTEMSETGYKRKRTWKLEEHKGEPTIASGFSKLNLYTPDTVVSTVLRRNNWEQMTLVCDITGSMAPYTAQIFSWLPSALASGKCSGFVFFNDGDNKKDNNKTIGKTGGLYATKTLQFDSIYRKALQAMSGGDGGDAVENDVEAVIYALNVMNPQGDIVLIADNWGAPRDLELFAKINRPIHIIVCGARGGLNPDYLFLARQTGGTLHTVGEDITNLSTMKEGETVKVGFQNFLLHDGHFVPLENFRKW